MYLKDNLKRGILVSEQDKHILESTLFYVNSRGYAVTNKKVGATRTTVLLHKLIFSTPGLVDHINQNKLDNRRDNLRSATRNQNGYNKGYTKRNTTGYKGVSKNAYNFIAYITVNSNRIHLGSYTSAEQAALVHDMAAKKHHKEFAVLNFNLELH